jgi:hypothetical protein
VRADDKLTAFLELESQLVVKGMDFSEKPIYRYSSSRLEHGLNRDRTPMKN